MRASLDEPRALSKSLRVFAAVSSSELVEIIGKFDPKLSCLSSIQPTFCILSQALLWGPVSGDFSYYRSTG